MSDHIVIDIGTPRPLNISVYLTLAVVAFIGLLILPNLGTQTLAVALCIGFGLVYRFADPALGTPRRAYIYFATQTVLLTCLIVLAKGSDVFGLLFFILGIQAVLTLPPRMPSGSIPLFYLLQNCLSP